MASDKPTIKAAILETDIFAICRRSYLELMLENGFKHELSGKWRVSVTKLYVSGTKSLNTLNFVLSQF